MNKHPRKNAGAAPFEFDAKDNHGYRYTTNAPLSCAVANERLTVVSVQWLSGIAQLKSVIDLGCGDGVYTNILSKAFPKATFQAGDPAKTAIEHAQKTFPQISFFVCDLQDKKALRKRSAEAGILRGVIHHVPQPEPAIKHAVECVQKLLIIEPNGWNPLVKIIEHTSKYHRQHGEKSYTSDTLSQWVRAAGARVDRISYVGTVPFFCPDLLIPILLKLQPFVEQSIFAKYLCGQVIIVASKPATR